MWLVVLSDQLQIVGLVSLYPTNYLICHRPLQTREVLRSPAFLLRAHAVLIRLSPSYPPRLGTFRCITHPFATRQLNLLPFDLHVKGMPPAFNLSQDQTL